MELGRSFFSSINYQNLLGYSEQLADKVADENQSFRNFCLDNFDSRLSFLLRHFRNCSDSDIPAPEHAGWEIVSKDIELIRQRYGNVILALFHFGLHRNILVDLACNRIPIVSPIAGKAYWNFYHQKNIAPKSFANCFNLVEVDDVSVGKQIIKHIRRGDLPAIYVDGNMGPDGTSVSSGGVAIQFCGKKINVKEGISRLANAFKIPVLPLFSVRKYDFDKSYKIIPGELLFSGSDLMQRLYLQLEGYVKKYPQDWEYITCAHRWIIADNKATSGKNIINFEETGLRLNREIVRLVEKDNTFILFKLNNQLAFKLPDWSNEFIVCISKGATANQIKKWLSKDSLFESKIKLIKELISRELVTTLK